MSRQKPQIHLLWSWVIISFSTLLLAGCAHLPSAPFTFVQVCDPQIGFTDYQQDLKRFEQAVSQINTLKPDFVVICGDLVNAANQKSFDDFNKAKSKLKTPCYCAPGNHDIGNEPTLETLRAYRASEGRDYFSFKSLGSTFVILNTQLWRSPLPGETEKQDLWLDQALAQAEKKGRPVFVVQHYPPFVETPDEPDAYFNIPTAKRRELLAAFERSGVRAVLAGHTHTTAARSFGSIQIVTSESTSRNFDKRPLGFRVWHVDRSGAFRHEFVPLQDRAPAVE
jgi:serine/threonine-protein phosphatase CPPED1